METKNEIDCLEEVEIGSSLVPDTNYVFDEGRCVCIHNKFIRCEAKASCDRCGWNPKSDVAKNRIEKFREARINGKAKEEKAKL